MSDEDQRRGIDRRFTDILPPEHPAIEALTRGRPAAPRDLGPLELLLGVWTAEETGWNMIALPFQGGPFRYRLLMNQYSENLQFNFVDDGVPNRGLLRPGAAETDQRVATVDYQQKIAQVVAEDFPVSGLAGPPDLPIHHEPGLWLYDKNLRAKDDQLKDGVASEIELDVARLASIPHGNSVLALGKSEVHDGMPPIPPLNALAAGRFEDLNTPNYDFKTDPYLEPYKHFIDNPFMGKVAAPGFPGFNPADMNEILRFANVGVPIERTTTLTVDTRRRSGGITNAPFAVREADPVSMKSTFWIQELADRDEFGKPKLRLQYSQVVMLEFFHPREDELPGRAVWPHVSIATLTKVPGPYKLRPA